MAVTVYVGSKRANLIRSVNRYVYRYLDVQKGYDLDWGQPNFKEEGLERWIQFRLILSSGQFIRQADETRLGEIRAAFLNFNIMERYPPRSGLYVLETYRKSCLEGFFLADIPVYDFSTEGSPRRGLLRTIEITHDGETDSGRLSGLRVWNMNFYGTYLLKWQ